MKKGRRVSRRSRAGRVPLADPDQTLDRYGARRRTTGNGYVRSDRRARLAAAQAESCQVPVTIRDRLTLRPEAVNASRRAGIGGERRRTGEGRGSPERHRPLLGADCVGPWIDSHFGEQAFGPARTACARRERGAVRWPRLGERPFHSRPGSIVRSVIIVADCAFP